MIHLILINASSFIVSIDIISFFSVASEYLSSHLFILAIEFIV